MNQAKGQSGRYRRWRWLGLLVLLPLLVPLLLVGMLASEGGSGWLLRQVGHAVTAGGIEFRFARSQGTLLRRLELSDVIVNAADTRIAATALRLHWRPQALFQRRLHVELIAIDGLRLVPPPPTDSTAPEPLQIPSLDLPVVVQVDRLAVDGLVVEQPDGAVTLKHIGLGLVADQARLHVADLQVHADGASAGGEVTVQTRSPHALSASIEASVAASLSGDEIGDIALQVTLGGVALRPEFDLRVSAPAVLRVRGGARLDQAPPAVDLDASWHGLRWPLRGPPQVTAGMGSLQLDGNVSDYRLVLRTPLEVADQPQFELALDGRGDIQGIDLQPLIARVGEGRLQADGRVDWHDGVAWRLMLLAERIDPGVFAADWPGEIGARVAVDGRLSGAGEATGKAVIETLAGMLRGYPVQAVGALDWHDDTLTVDGLDLTTGPNRVRVDGRVAQDLDLAFDIEAPDLGALLPGLVGRLSGKGKLGGTPALPQVQARVQGGDLAYRETRAAALALDIDWRGASGRGELQASGLAAAGTELHLVSAVFDGGIDAHRLEFTAEGEDVGMVLAGQGGLQSGRTEWRGILRRLEARSGELGSWRLRVPTGLRLGQARADVEQLCLTQGDAALCVRGGWSQSAGLGLEGDLVDFDLAPLARLLPGDAQLDGRLGVRFDVSGPPQRPTATFALRPGDGRIRVDDGIEPFLIAYRNARLDGRLEDDEVSAELAFELGPNGRASGRVRLAGERDGQRALAGRIEADFPDLALIAGFVPDLQEVKGRLAIAVDLAGMAARPEVSGTLTIADGGAQLPASGIDLSGFALRLSGDGQGPLQLSAEARSGEGAITIDGSIDPAGPGSPAVDLRIRGNDFQAVRLPEARAWISPDLNLLGGNPYRLEGTLRIPRAAVELKELPRGTVAVSDDEVIVGEEAAPSKAAGGVPVEARVRVELGEAVTFKGFGLSTGLRGAVDAASGPRGTTVDGKIELRDASYKAYGQDLSVERGRLLFAGPPGNPDVDLLAVRESLDGQIRAYLAVAGPLAKPRPRIYTEPVLPEAEAVAYLVTGRGLDQAGQSEGGDIASAALSLGMSRSDPLLQDLGDRVGLDDLRIESGRNGLADSSLLLGKYLNPDLYLGYTQGLMNPEGAVLLRLRLSEQLEVESRSGGEQSVDLLYKIEHD